MGWAGRGIARVAAAIAAPIALVVAFAWAGWLSGPALRTYALLGLAWACGAVAIAAAPWSRSTRWIAAGVHALLAVPLLPMIGLVAACWAGGCV